MNLEQEFQKLMDEAVKSINDKKAKGVLSHQQAEDLLDIVSERRHSRTRAWNSSGCSFDDDDSTYDDNDGGWNRSGQAC
jgi:hypothetical protein